MYDASTISTFVHQLDDEIAIESLAVKANKVLIAIKKVINNIRHAFIRMGYRLKQMRSYQIPKEIGRSIQTVVDLSSDILNSASTISSGEISQELNKLYRSREYRMLFDKKPSDYAKDEYISIDTKAVSANLIQTDKELNRVENQVMTLSHMNMNDISYEKLPEKITALEETAKLLSLKMQVLSKYFSFGQTITGEEIPLGREFEAEVVHY